MSDATSATNTNAASRSRRSPSARSAHCAKPPLRAITKSGTPTPPATIRSSTRSSTTSCTRNGRLTEAELEQIYEAQFSPSRQMQQLDQVGTQVKDEIDQVMSMIEAAAGTATSYTESLAGVTQQLGNTKDREGLRSIVESLVQTAKDMEVSNQALEARLNASKQEINQLQKNLETVRHESLTDPLTTLANRKFFDQALEKALADAATKREPLSTDDDRHRSLQDFQRQLRPSDRRPGAAARRNVGEEQRQGPGYRRALRRRGIRGGSAEHGAALGHDRRRPYPPRGHDQAADEALDPRAARPHHHFHRGGDHAAKATPRSR